VTLAPLAFAAALILHPATVPNFVRWHTHLWDAVELARSSRLHVAVDGRFETSPLCATAVVSQSPQPGAVVSSGTVVHLRASATCRHSSEPGATEPPNLVGRPAGSTVASLSRWGDNWEITFPPLPPTRVPHLYDAYRIVGERTVAGVVRLDAALVPGVVRQRCPIFGLDTFTTYRHPAARFRLRRADVVANALGVARPLVTQEGFEPRGTPVVASTSVERVGPCIEWVVTITGGLFNVQVADLVPYAAGNIQFPARRIRIVVNDKTGNVLGVQRAFG
jgi:hypothetical protein